MYICAELPVSLHTHTHTLAHSHSLTPAHSHTHSHTSTLSVVMGWGSHPSLCDTAVLRCDTSPDTETQCNYNLLSDGTSLVILYIHTVAVSPVPEYWARGIEPLSLSV